MLRSEAILSQCPVLQSEAILSQYHMLQSEAILSQYHVLQSEAILSQYHVLQCEATTPQWVRWRIATAVWVSIRTLLGNDYVTSITCVNQCTTWVVNATTSISVNYTLL